MSGDPKAALQKLYEERSRAELLLAGQQHLDGHLGLRARRHTRRFWIIFGLIIAVAVWGAVVTAVYLLERTTASAEVFEHQRRKQIDALAE